MMETLFDVVIETFHGGEGPGAFDGLSSTGSGDDAVLTR